MALKIIFAGTPEFSLPVLRALLSSPHQLCAVYTRLDRPAGRGQPITASCVKRFAIKHQLPLYQPTTFRDENEQKRLADFHADVMVVIAYGLLLTKPILEAPRLGCVNVHASLLPRWRGAAPVQRAILAGDTETGVTVMQMQEGLDTGDILKKKRCAILPYDTAQDLHDRLSVLGAEALLETLNEAEANTTKPLQQDDTQACYAAKITKQEARVDWKKSAQELDRSVRAFNPWPVAYTRRGDETVRIWQAVPLDDVVQAAQGTILRADKNGIDVATGSGILRLLKLQLPGGKVLSASEILNARYTQFSPGTALS